MALEALGARRVFIVGDGSVGQKEYPAVEVGEVLKEAMKEGDLVVSDIKEHYRNLTYKHALALRWSASFCPSATFLLKMDDDIMVDVWGFADLLRARLVLGPDETLQTDKGQGRVLNPSEAWNTGQGRVLNPSEPWNKGEGRVLNPSEAWTAGLLQTDLQPQREGGKWRVTSSEYPGHLYPDFLAGWAYIATRSAAAALVKAATEAASPPFWIDDVYMTGILATVAGVPRYSLSQYYSLMSGAASCCLKATPTSSPSLPQPLAPPTSSPSLPQPLAPPTSSPSLPQPQHPPALLPPSFPSLPLPLAPPSSPSPHQHPPAPLAPLCGLLVVPSDKNLTLMKKWLKAVSVCHDGGYCLTISPTNCTHYTHPQHGVGTVFIIN
ncbi:hypothetical protein Pmani_024515 [Petrolisthes manimaculis]|uniref:Hexosyltransferase n=1 Tax=Petrolisthes manimaculis TaxID=1843537 RepID=A0AAE1P9X5_9EUCA|nr:hypothetical protein Pmani_024515 [Petrolisthes manimaculis]